MVEIINAAAVRYSQYLTACVRVVEALVHSSIRCTATFIIVPLRAFDKQKRALSFVVFAFCHLLTDAVYETLIHCVYYFHPGSQGGAIPFGPHLVEIRAQPDQKRRR